MKYNYNIQLCKLLGSHIRKIREKKEISMRQLAAMSDMEYTHLFKVEHGKINTSISTLNAIAEALEIPLIDLFRFEISPKAKK